MIFSTFDVVALVIQAIGGSGAAQGEQNGTSTVNSTHIMVSRSSIPHADLSL